MNPRPHPLPARPDLPGKPRLGPPLRGEDALERRVSAGAELAGTGGHGMKCTGTVGHLRDRRRTSAMRPVPTPPLHERLRALREERGLSQPELFRRTVGVGFDTVRGIETPPEGVRHRYPSPQTLAAIADALELPADSFPEYRLALARRALDERIVGLDEAVALLSEIERALGDRAVALAGRARRPPPTSSQPKRAGRRGGPSRPAG